MAKPSRPGQGERRICLPRDYTVVDTETTGLSTETCGLIEVSALRVRGGQVVEEFSTLIRPPWRQVLRDGEWREGYVDDFIQGLTGITDEMLEGAPLPIEALPLVRDFLGEDLLLGHNVGFDAAFLYDSFQKYLNCPLKNDTLDHLTISRKLLPDLPHHRLGDVAAALGVPYEGAHRALADCFITYGCYGEAAGPGPFPGHRGGLSAPVREKEAPKAPVSRCARPSLLQKAGGAHRQPCHPGTCGPGGPGRGPGGEGGHGKNGFPGRARPWRQAPAGQKRRARHPAPRGLPPAAGGGGVLRPLTARWGPCIMGANEKRRLEPMDGQFGAVIVAAGNSTRMGGAIPKVLENLNGRPVLLYSFLALAACPQVGELCVVCREEDRPRVEGLLRDMTDKPFTVVAGGRERQDSVLNGVGALSPERNYLLIHDGARPFVTPELASAVCRDAVAYGAATAAVPSKDTCKLSDGEGFVESTPPRERLMAIQTPQAFEREMYLYAARRAQAAGLSYTDDCQLIEAAGGQVRLTPGDYRNIKLTTPEDRQAARAYLGKGEKAMRVGSGYDVHKLVEGRKLILGGVEVPFEKGLLGHSDADVLAHAIADALLGAAALGDIGKLFPDTDPAYEGADSLVLLERVCALLGEKGFSIGNIDATLIAQRPKLAPFIPQMRENLAKACGVSLSQVSVKATTEEGLGFTGSGEGMAASAVCLLEN